LAVSRPEWRCAGLALGLILASAGALLAQEARPPELAGTAYVGEAPMQEGTIVLHHLANGTQGELDSTTVAADGTFAFDLPRLPRPDSGDVFFASVRHDGVLYFGPAVTQTAQLDSVYEIFAYDTLLAPAEGLPMPLQSRSIFFEPDSAGWRVTDLFQLRNDSDRTLVTRPGGRVWRHPLPEGATDVTTGEGELSFAAAEYEGGALVVRAAVPPGERLFVVRYRVGSLGIDVPTQGPTEALDVLIREPAPPVEVPGLELLDRIELEAGSTYIRFTGADVDVPFVRIVESEAAGPPRVEWAAFLLALVLGAAGLWALRPTPARPGSGVRPAPPVSAGARSTGSDERRALLHEVARLDEDFSSGDAAPEVRRRYEARRAELIRRIREL
jgi:hypothetical protein